MLQEKLHDRDNEEEIARLMLPILKAEETKRIPDLKFGIDRCFLKQETGGFSMGRKLVVCYAEIKDRSGRNGNRGLEWEFREGYYISVSKMMGAKLLYAGSYKPVWLIVRFIGGKIAMVRLDDYRAEHGLETIWAGRQDRGLSTDIEPELVIPWQDFGLQYSTS